MDDRTDNFGFATQGGPGSAIHQAGGALVVPVDNTLDEAGLEQLGKEILKRLDRHGSRRVVINVSGVCLLTSRGFTLLRNTARAVGMMGGTTVFAGFQAGVVSALVDLDVDLSGILAAGTVDEALALMERS